MPFCQPSLTRWLLGGRTPIPDWFPANLLWKKTAIYFVGPNILCQKVHNAFALDPPHATFNRVDSAVSKRIDKLHRTINRDGLAGMNKLRKRASTANTRPNLIEAGSLVSVSHDVKNNKGVVRQSVSRSVRLRQPFSADSFAGAQVIKHRPSLMDPRIEHAVLLVVRVPRRISCTNQRNKMPLYIGNTDVCSIQLLLDNNPVMLVADFFRADVTLTIRYAVVANASTAAGKVSD